MVNLFPVWLLSEGDLLYKNPEHSEYEEQTSRVFDTGPLPGLTTARTRDAMCGSGG